MRALRRCHRSFLGALLGVGLLAISATPVLALGHRGDPGEIAALRGGGSDHGGFEVGHSQAAPEIDGGVVATAIALVVGGLLVVLDRRPR
jgi:hypothetical protein